MFRRAISSTTTASGTSAVAARPLIVAADHPSLDGAVARFESAAGRSARSSASPEHRAHPVRLAAIADGRVVGVAEQTGDGRVTVVVERGRRRASVARDLRRATREVAARSGRGAASVTGS